MSHLQFSLVHSNHINAMKRFSLEGLGVLPPLTACILSAVPENKGNQILSMSLNWGTFKETDTKFALVYFPKFIHLE